MRTISPFHDPNWSGLPVFPAWLHWFGPAYAPSLENLRTLPEARSLQGGILIRSSEEPARMESPESLEPPLPDHLIAPTEFIPEEIAHPDLEEGAPPRIRRKEVGLKEFLRMPYLFYLRPSAWVLLLGACLVALGVSLSLGYVLAVAMEKLSPLLQILLVGILAGLPAIFSALLFLWAGQKALLALGLSLLRQPSSRALR